MDQNFVDELLNYIDRVHQRTRRVVLCIPSEKLEHSFGEGRFTLGDLVRHIAGINRYMFIETATGGTSRYPGHDRALADGFELVVQYFENLHTEAVTKLRRLPIESFAGKCTTPEGTEITVWKWLRAMIEHECHHRGQIYLHLATLGVITPPLFGLTSEEVKARSVG